MAGPDSARIANPFGIARRALGRLWGRDVMLYTGGVSFYAMLAGFPALAILVSVYSLLSTPDIAAKQAQDLSLLLPDAAQSLFADELQRLAHAPMSIVGIQGVFAVVIALYAAHRGVKALIAGLTGGLTLMYRYVMAVDLLSWRSSVIGGLTGALLSLTASWACAFYVDRVARLGATYGSIAAVVVCLIWISWNVNAAFFGGALATETELAIKPKPAF